MTLTSMPRQARLDIPGQYYHVIVRGVERRSIFRADGDRFDFLRRLQEGISKTGTLCLNWALMTNHLHLLLRAGVRGLSSLMQPLFTGYVGAFNRRYGRVGHLVQNRYKAILCEEDPYLQELMRYIPLNPVRAKMVKTPGELAVYPWTGHAAMMGKASAPWQAVNEALSHFGDSVEQARQAYESFVIEGWNQGKRKDLEGGGLLRSFGGMKSVLQARAAGARLVFDAQILGSAAFVERMFQEAEQIESAYGRLRESGLTLSMLQELAGDVMGVQQESILSRERSQPVSQARALFIFGAVDILRKRSVEVGRLLGLSSGSVSEALAKGRRLAEQYAFVEKARLRAGG